MILSSRGLRRVSSYKGRVRYSIWNGNFLDLQFYVEISEISGNNLCDISEISKFQSFYMEDFRYLSGLAIVRYINIIK